MAGRKKKNSILLKAAFFLIIVVIFATNTDSINNSLNVIRGDEQADNTDTIKAGAFNIQVFGTSKAAKDDVMDILSKIIREYDIIAIEEIRDSSQTALPELVDSVNRGGFEYSYIVSERLGRTSSKEQYAYIYNTKTVETDGTPFVYPEPENTDPFHREPYIASFKSVDGIFNATFVTIHTDPDEAEEEIYSLYGVSEYVKDLRPDKKKVVIMGDFNADGSYFDEDSFTPLRTEGYRWIIGNDIDTTTGATDCTYDRIVITGDDEFYTGDAGVFRFDTKYSLTPEFTKEVSDHYPVYAEFSTGKQVDPGFSLADSLSTVMPADTPQTGASAVYDLEITSLDVHCDTVEISNNGDISADIGGFRLSDENEENSYIFPAGVLIRPKDAVTIYSGRNIGPKQGILWETENDVWDNTGDTAKLYDISGILIAKKVS